MRYVGVCTTWRSLALERFIRLSRFDVSPSGFLWIDTRRAFDALPAWVSWCRFKVPERIVFSFDRDTCGPTGSALKQASRFLSRLSPNSEMKSVWLESSCLFDFVPVLSEFVELLEAVQHSGCRSFRIGTFTEVRMDAAFVRSNPVYHDVGDIAKVEPPVGFIDLPHLRSFNLASPILLHPRLWPWTLAVLTTSPISGLYVDLQDITGRQTKKLFAAIQFTRLRSLQIGCNVTLQTLLEFLSRHQSISSLVINNNTCSWTQ